MSIGKIPPELHASVMQLSDAGKDSEEIAGWLWREHKIEISARQVRSLVRRRRTELADVAKGVVRDELRRHLLPVVRRLARVGVRAAVLERKASARARTLREQQKPDYRSALQEELFALKAQDRQLKAANLLLHYAGLNQPDAQQPGAGPANADARTTLLEKLRRLATNESPATIGPDDEPKTH